MNTFGLAVLIALLLFFSSCQEEFELVDGQKSEQNILAHSNTADLIEKASTYDGSYDNMVDGASCFAVKFPYTVSLNGRDIPINSKDDLQSIKKMLAELLDERALLDLIFPVKITLGDFSEILVENREDLAELVLDCMEGGEDRIGCIEFIYPITLFTLELDNQQAGEAIVDSDMEMRRFFAELDNGLMVNLHYPIQLKKWDGGIMEIGNMEELVSALEHAKKECDNVKLLTKKALDDFLVKCPLKVREVWRQKVDSSDRYYGSILAFSLDGTVILTYKNGDGIAGIWSGSETDQGVLLDLQFPDTADFTLDWQVYRPEDQAIILYRDNGDKIVLKKWCDEIPAE